MLVIAKYEDIFPGFIKGYNMIFKPPMNIASGQAYCSVFLAGSIEMGSATNWQDDLAIFFFKLGYDVYNPRRDDWDSSWEQKYTNPQFYQQVNWELNALDHCTRIVMYLDPNTKSPVSLLELGLYATSGKLVVICPEGFWRKGNVDMVCNKYAIPLFSSIEEFKQNHHIAGRNLE